MILKRVIEILLKLNEKEIKESLYNIDDIKFVYNGVDNKYTIK